MKSTIEEKVKALVVPMLLTIIAGLLSLFGSISIDILKSMDQKIEGLLVENAGTQKEIENLKETDRRLEDLLRERSQVFAIKPEENEFFRRKK